MSNACSFSSQSRQNSRRSSRMGREHFMHRAPAAAARGSAFWQVGQMRRRAGSPSKILPDCSALRALTILPSIRNPRGPSPTPCSCRACPKYPSLHSCKHGSGNDILDIGNIISQTGQQRGSKSCRKASIPLYKWMVRYLSPESMRTLGTVHQSLRIFPIFLPRPP